MIGQIGSSTKIFLQFQHKQLLDVVCNTHLKYQCQIALPTLPDCCRKPYKEKEDRFFYVLLFPPVVYLATLCAPHPSLQVHMKILIRK